MGSGLTSFARNLAMAPFMRCAQKAPYDRHGRSLPSSSGSFILNEGAIQPASHFLSDASPLDIDVAGTHPFSARGPRSLIGCLVFSSASFPPARWPYIYFIAPIFDLHYDLRTRWNFAVFVNFYPVANRACGQTTCAAKRHGAALAKDTSSVWTRAQLSAVTPRGNPPVKNGGITLALWC